MSKLAPGTYIIVNRVLSPNDEMLAITFNGRGKTATVTPTTAATSAQRWVIKDYDTKTQYVTPADAPDLQPLGEAVSSLSSLRGVTSGLFGTPTKGTPFKTVESPNFGDWMLPTLTP